MNKSMKRFMTALAAVTLALLVWTAGALADGDEYQVRVYAGNVGATVNGGSVWSFTAGYGESVTFSPDMVQLPEDSPYYVRGVRESGLDNNTVSSNVMRVTEDADYVVAYGIKGELVPYTVNYVDEAGSALAPSQTYYGNAGDKPVVAYLYVDGYTPMAYNLTRTLSENGGDNVFTFVYSQIVRPTPAPPAPSPTPVIYGAEEEPAAGGEAGAEAGGEAGAEAGGEAAPGGEAEATPETEPEAEAAPQTEPETEPEAAPETEPETESIPENETPLNQEPQEIIDLDENDVPLAGDAPNVEKTEKAKAPEKEKTELQKERERAEKNLYMSAGLLGAALIAIAVMAAALLKKRGAKR